MDIPNQKAQPTHIKTAIVASEAFKAQYNINSQIIIPGNLYGNTITFPQKIFM